MEAKEEKIRVAIRVRPLPSSSSATINNEAITSSPDGQNVLVYSDPSRTNAASFRCGTFLPSDITQDAVFDEIRAPELVEAALDGFPVTIFAYGQTGAGKSFTIFGKEDMTASSNARAYGGGSVGVNDGILPRAAMKLMETVEARRDLFEYTLRVTCVEIYNEQVRDLFDTKKESLPVRHSNEHGFYLENATVVQCKTAKEIIRVVKLAATNRIKSAHLLNERSNRSHCIVTIYIDSMPRDPSMGAKKYGKLTIVDLAGSERANDTGAVGQQLKETGHINKSLYCLSKVIQAMSANANSKMTGKPKFVPVRDSKLTMLLIDSLGGNSKTLMLACVNAAPQFSTESIRTLEFAMGVAKIKNRPTAVLNPHEKLIIDLKEEIRQLKLENMMLRSRTPGYFVDHPEQMGEMDPTYGEDDNMATSPLGRALLSGRHRPEDLKLLQQYRHESYGDNNAVAEYNGGTAFSAPNRSGTGTGLSGIKKMAAQRRTGAPIKKKKPLSQKPKKKTRQSSSITPQSPAMGFTLPPVRQSAPLFHKRDEEKVFIMPEAGYQRHQQPPVQRPASPPPEYDDLFGIETVPVSASSFGGSLSMEQPQQQLRLDHAALVSRRPSLASLPSFQQTNEQATNPGDDIQRLLRDMMTTQPTKQPSYTKTPAPLKRQASGSSGSLLGSQQPQFEDARTEDLFQQLCRL